MEKSKGCPATEFGGDARRRLLDRGADTPLFGLKTPPAPPQSYEHFGTSMGQELIAKKPRFARRKLKHLCKTAEKRVHNSPATEFARSPHRDRVKRGAETPETRLRGWVGLNRDWGVSASRLGWLRLAFPPNSVRVWGRAEWGQGGDGSGGRGRGVKNVQKKS